MKKILFLFIFSLLISCSTTNKSKNLPKFEVYKQKKGYVRLKNNKRIYFSNAEFGSNRIMIRVQSQFVRQTILWVHIKDVYINNQ